MNAIELAEDLQDRSGLPEKQAKGIVHTILAAVDESTRNLVTKDYLRAEMSDLRFTLIMWFSGIMVAVATLVVTAMKLIPPVQLH